MSAPNRQNPATNPEKPAHMSSIRRIIKTWQKQAAEARHEGDRHKGEPTAYSYQLGIAQGLTEAAETLELWFRDQGGEK